MIDTDGGSRALVVPFKFEELWIQEPDCEIVIQNAWTQVCTGSPALKLCKKSRLLKTALKKWNRERVGNIQGKISNLSLYLESIQNGSVTKANQEIEMTVHLALLEEQRKEEVL